jgi:hypothetical protein
MNSAPNIILSSAERSALELWIANERSPNALRQRCLTILACAAGKTNLAVAQEVGLCNLTVGKWRKRFLDLRLRAFEPEKRGRPVSPLLLNAAERKSLEEWTRFPNISSQRSLYARVILALAAGQRNSAVSRDTGLSEKIVGRLRASFLAKRLDAAADESGTCGGCDLPEMSAARLEAEFEDRTGVKKLSRLLRTCQNS